MHLNEHIHLQEVTDQFRIEVLQPDIICIIGRVRDLIEFFLNSSFSTSSDTLLVSPNEVDILTWNFIPFKPNLTFMDEIVKSENMDVDTIVTPSNVKKVESNHESADVKNNGDAVEPKTIRKNSFRPPVIKDWNSDDDSKVEFISNVKTGRISGKGEANYVNMQSIMVGRTCNIKRGRDTKIPQSGGPPVKVGDEAIHKELGDRMKWLPP
ncbi:hypothetical protein Tco_0463005 [Tanacetum coccineum]